MRHVASRNSIIAYAPVNKATAASHEIVAARAGNQIVVWGYLLAAAGAVNVTWQSAATALTGAMTMATGVPNGQNGEEYGVLATASGEALNLLLSGAVQVSGFVVYSYVDTVANL